MKRWNLVAGIGCLMATAVAEASFAAPSSHRGPFATAVSSEFPIDRGIPGPSSGDPVAPRIAASSSGYLVVWADYTGPVVLGGRTELLAARLDTAGNMLDTTPIGIHDFWSAEKGTPVVASDGTDYFVAWSADVTYGISGTRVRASDGAVLDAPLPLGSGSSSDGPVLTCVAGTYVLAYWRQTSNGTTEIRTERIKNGQVLDAVPGALLATTTQGPNLDIAPGPGQAFVVWGSSGVREDTSTGAVLDATPIQFANLAAGTYPHVTYDGTANYVMVWDDGHSTLWDGRVRASDGTVLDPDDTLDMLPGSKELRGAEPQLVPDSVRVGLADGLIAITYALSKSTLSSEVHAFAVDPASALPVTAQDAGADPLIATAIVTGADTDLAMGAPGTAAFVYESAFAPTGGRGGVEERMLAHSTGQLVDANATTTYLSVSAQNSMVGAAASDGTDYFVVWNDERTSAPGAYGARVSAAMQSSLDPSGLPLAPGWWATPRSLVSTGTEYLFAWSTGTTVQARAIALDGTLGAPFTVSTGGTTADAVAATYDGTNYFVVWWDNSAIHGVRIAASTHAIVDTTPITVIATGNRYGSLAVTVDNPSDPTRKTFLVAYQESITIGSTTSVYVRFARVRAHLGSPIDQASPFTLSKSASGYRTIDAASDGTNFFVAWSEQRSTTALSGIFGTRVVPLDATILDMQGTNPGILLADTPDYDEMDTAVWDGTDYVIGWTHTTTTSASQLFLPPTPLSFTRVTASMAPLDPPSGLTFQTEAITNLLGNVDTGFATNGNGQILAPYAVFSPAAGQLGQRLRGRFLNDDGQATDAGVEAGPDAATVDGAPEAAADSGAPTMDAASDAGGGADAAQREEGGANMDASVTGGGDAGAAGPSGSSSGCGCRAAGEPTESSGAVVVLAAAATVLARRRRGARVSRHVT